MSSICRVGDLVVGTCMAPALGHPRAFVGVWVTGSGDVGCNGIPVVRVGDIGITDCGHTILAVAGSDNTSVNGMPVVRVGDAVIVIEGGIGVTVTGSGDVSN